MYEERMILKENGELSVEISFNKDGPTQMRVYSGDWQVGLCVITPDFGHLIEEAIEEYYNLLTRENDEME